MNLELVCEALRNPFGVPAHPVIFLILLVLTWAMHITAVFVMLGSTALSLLGAFSSNAYWQKLSKTMLPVAKFSVGLAIVLGVAPLLFVQTLYDQWYVSNVISARWVIGFIVLLIVAYYAMYYRYYASKHTDGKDSSRWSLALSLALLFLLGFIMHVLTSQMLKPEMWMQWYAPNGHIDPSGSILHDYNVWRYLYFMSLTLPVTGAGLLAKNTYFADTKTYSPDYLLWLDELGRKLMLLGGAVAVVFYLSWMRSLSGNSSGFTVSIAAFVGLLASIALAVIPSFIPKERIGYGAFAASFVSVLLIAITRESLRISTLHKACHYNVLDYPVHFDGFSTALFLGSLVFLAIPVLSYFIILVWQVGKCDGIYIASPLIKRLGRISLIAFGVWFVQYFLFGLITVM